MEIYVSFIFNTEVNINCKKCIIVVTFFNSDQYLCPKENTPAQVLSQLCHCQINKKTFDN